MMKRVRFSASGMGVFMSVMLLLVLLPTVGFAQSSTTVPVQIQSYAAHSSGDIVYHYVVTNHTQNRPITGVSIGEGFDKPGTELNEVPELAVFPKGSYWGPPSEFGDHKGISSRLGGVSAAPEGWEGQVQGYEEAIKFSFRWDTIGRGYGIRPGGTANFSVMVPKSDRAYLTGHVKVGFGYSQDQSEGPSFWDYTTVLEPIDTTPPVLSVTVRPSSLWPPNQKLTEVVVYLSVKDDYDPQPEIKLESVTANEPLEPGDIVDAAIGSDDRQFRLAAKREGSNQAGRIYTITYSATDATGNKATASATVTVPHDQGK